MNQRIPHPGPVPVFHSYPKWMLSGVNSWTVNLARCSGSEDFKHKVLFTGIPKQSCPELKEAGIEYCFLDLPEKRSRRAEWNELKHFLERNAPCIYIPNYDFHRSCAIGTLSSDVKVCLVIHSDEECYFDAVKRVGSDCDSIVCVSTYLANKVRRDFPNLAEIVMHIPYGVPIPKEVSLRSEESGPLRLAYCNRLQQYQKRVFDLPPICLKLKEADIDFQLSIAGDGPDREELETQFEEANVTDQVDFLGLISQDEVMQLLLETDVFLLTSDFEGLPISLLEAMSVGTVPVVYEIDSGINDAIEHGINGLKVSHGDSKTFAATLAGLASGRQQLKQLSDNAVETITMRFSTERMSAQYRELFFTLLYGDHSSPLPERSGKIYPPKDLKLTTRAGKWIQRILTP